MSLSNDIIAHQIDPVLFDQNRCEFRIDPKVWLSNWRLADLGCTVTNGTKDGTGGDAAFNTRYAAHLGSYALISRIRLLNGTVEIAELRNVKQFLAFNNLQRTNANAFNVSRTLNKSSFSLDVENADSTIELKNYGDLDTQITDADSTSALSYLDLTQVLPYLKSQSYVLGTEMQNLRLIIEWVSLADINKVLVGQNTDGITEIKIIQPTLILDEVADPKVASKLKNSPITYVNLDHEVVNVAAGATTVNQRLRAFDDKTVRRMLMINEDVNNSQPSAYMAGLTSYAMYVDMYNQKTQFTLNGQKMLPYEGITSENQQLAMLHDTWGTHILPQGAQYFDLDKKADLYKAHDVFNDATLLEANNLVGQMSYGGYSVNANVDELLLEYQRAAYADRSQAVDTISQADPAVVTTTEDHGFETGDIVAILGATGADAVYFSGTNLPITKTGAKTFTYDKDTSAKTLTGTIIVYNQKDYDKLLRSKSQMNLLFWGEVVKTMSVSNNNVSISYG